MNIIQAIKARAETIIHDPSFKARVEALRQTTPNPILSHACELAVGDTGFWVDRHTARIICAKALAARELSQEGR